MSILDQQRVISEMAFSNVITTNRLARSLSAPNGYYGDDGQYPDSRTHMTGAAIVGKSNESLTFERIRNSYTAGHLDGYTAAGTKEVRGAGDFDVFEEEEDP